MFCQWNSRKSVAWIFGQCKKGCTIIYCWYLLAKTFPIDRPPKNYCLMFICLFCPIQRMFLLRCKFNLIHHPHVLHAVPLFLEKLFEDAVQLEVGGRRDVVVQLGMEINPRPLFNVTIKCIKNCLVATLIWFAGWSYFQHILSIWNSLYNLAAIVSIVARHCMSQYYKANLSLEMRIW